MTPRNTESSVRRGRGDDGAALVEFALVAVLLSVLIFGIINFGFLLSFKQDVTRAAAEGARAGAVAFPASDALDDARAATNEAVAGFGKTCGSGGMTCTTTIVDCDGAGPETAECVRVQLDYDYKNHPLLPDLPLISAFLPDNVQAVSVARLNR